MAATLNNVVGTTTASATSITSNAPTSIVIGDMMVASIRALGGSAFVAPTGWVSLGTTTGYASFYKTVYSTEASTYQFTWTGAGKASCLIGLIKGQSGPYAYDPQALSQITNASSGNIVASSITTTKVAAELLVSFYHSDSVTGITVPVAQTPLGTVSANAVSAVAGYETLAAVGATGTRTATGGTAINSAFSVAFYSLGAIGRGMTQAWNNMRALPVWLADTPGLNGINSTQLTAITAVDNFGLLTTDVLGALSGTVKINGVAQSYVKVYLYYRPTGQKINAAITDANGAYSFAGLDRSAVSNKSYYAVAVDPDGLGTQYDSGIYDRLIPS